MYNATAINASLNKFEEQVFNLTHHAEQGDMDALQGAGVYHLQSVCEYFGINYDQDADANALRDLLECCQ